METYLPRSILLTGGCGFIGSHVVTKLVTEFGYKVIVLDVMDYCSNIRNLDSVKDCDNLKILEGNINSADFLNYLLVNEEIDTILHFAAKTHVDNSFGNSYEFTFNNVLGTHQLLEAARRYGNIKRFIHVSTDEVYGEMSFCSGTASMECATLEPTNPYSASKAAAEMIVKAYMTSYGLPCIITRGNNVFGPHQFPEKLIPKFALLALKGDKMPVHGAGDALRSYLYVSDVVDAFVVVLHQGKIGEVYNIGTTVERTTVQVARDICAFFNLDSSSSIVHVPDRLFNDRRYFIDDSKLMAIGWAPQVPWEKGLQLTIEWYRTFVFGKAYWPNYECALVPHPGRYR